jgi:hypothetical protein
LALIATAAASFLLNRVISAVPTAVVSAELTPYDRAAAPDDDDDVYLNRLQVSFDKYSLHVKYQLRRHKYRTNKRIS